MKSKLIKLSDTHYIIVDDSEIKAGDYIYESDQNTVNVAGHAYNKNYNDFKITHSTQPLEEDVKFIGTTPKITLGFDKIKPLSLSEVEEVINGYSIDLTKLCYYDRRNPDFSIKEDYGYNKEEVEASGNFAKKDCACDNCFYGRAKLTEQLIAHKELVKDKLFTIDDMKNFGLWLGDNLKDLKGKTIDEIFDKSPFALSIEWNVTFDEQGKLKLVKS